MRRTLKILVILIVITMVSTIVLPALNMLPVNMGTICAFLSQIASSTIVNASDDYLYGGNLHFDLTADDEMIIGGWGNEFNSRVECSINGSEYEDYIWRSTIIPLNNSVNEIIVRDTNHVEVTRAIIIKEGDEFIVIQNSQVRYQLGDSAYVRKKENIESSNNYNVEFEYSLDGGQSYNDIFTIGRTTDYYVGQPWGVDFTVVGGTLFSDKIIIRKKSNQEIVYQTPDNIDIEEEYSYENGKTKVTFKNVGDKVDIIKYSYEKDEQVTDGDVVEVEENTDLTLRANAHIEFQDKLYEKDVQIKVIKTEKPTIEIDEENSLELTAGSVENDEVENIYYSVDDGEPIVYTEKIALDLEPGEHEIRAYQTTLSGVKSEVILKSVTIEEKEPEREEQDDEENKGENKEDKTAEEDSEARENSEDQEKTEEPETNEEKQKENNTVETKNENKEKNKKLNKIAPQTGDNVIIFIAIIFSIIMLNVVIKKKRK